MDHGTRPCCGDDQPLRLLVPPPGGEPCIRTLDDALAVGVDLDLFAPLGVLVAWLDGDGRWLVAVASEPGAMCPFALWCHTGALGAGVGAAAAIAYSFSDGDGVVREAELRCWRDAAAESAAHGPPLLDWILVGHEHLRSMAVTSGTARAGWEA